MDDLVMFRIIATVNFWLSAAAAAAAAVVVAVVAATAATAAPFLLG